MNTIHEFDANDKSTWPDESRNGKYVLCKMDSSKREGHYEYDVCMTKLVTDRYDGIIVAWMEIPLEMKDFKKGQKHHYVDIRDAWEEFRKTGLMVFVNSFLHIFGWAIFTVYRGSGEFVGAWPERTTYRGFHERVMTRSYRRLTDYMVENAKNLKIDMYSERVDINDDLR